MKTTILFVPVVMAVMAVCGPAMAERGGPNFRNRDLDHRYDRRFDRHAVSHRSRYFHPGYRLGHLPSRHHHFVHRGRDYYYFGGSFFLHPGDHYEVVHPPYGARVPYLPPGYVTFHVGPRRYFYFNYVYYLWDEHHRDYIVVEEPAGAEEAVVRGISSEIYAYPAQGQSAAEQDRDYYDCHTWSVDESGYDPTLEGQNVYKSRDYRRAMIACLEARGYSVR